jgi:hypothetical protein
MESPKHQKTTNPAFAKLEFETFDDENDDTDLNFRPFLEPIKMTFKWNSSL